MFACISRFRRTRIARQLDLSPKWSPARSQPDPCRQAENWNPARIPSVSEGLASGPTLVLSPRVIPNPVGVVSTANRVSAMVAGRNPYRVEMAFRSVPRVAPERNPSLGDGTLSALGSAARRSFSAVLVCFLSLLLCLLPVFGQASLNQRERKGLDDALFIAGLTEDDLGYEKKANKDPYRLPLNALALDQPVAAADALMDLHEKGQGTLADALMAGCDAVFGDKPEAIGPSASTVQLPGGIPERLRAPLGYLLGCISEANGRIRTALRALSPKEKRELIEGLPQWAVGTDLVKFGFIKQPPPDPARMLVLLQKVDLKEIRRAGLRLARQVEGVLPTWRTLSKTVPLTGTIRFRVDTLAVELSGQGDDDHTSLNTNLCIDLGGRNRYLGRYAAGVGYASVLIDCGQSTYDVPDLSIGSGLLGVGLAYELGEGTEYRGHSLSFGCGLAGIGGLFNDGGRSRFQSVALTQGFGMFGCGLLLNTGGSDSFRADLLAQGAARTQGLGWFIAQRGNDVLRLGGLVPAPGGHRSSGQGYAEGLGGVAGGVGLLTSFGADDTYIGEDGCQGAAFKAGVGSFYDAGGHGTRSALARAQGFASDQAGAFLFDLGGSDSFSVRRSACHGFGGALSTAFVVARGGNDLFASGDGRPATGVGCGLGVVIADGPGNTFAAFPGLGVPSDGLDAFGIFCSVGGLARLLNEAPSVSQFDEGGVVLQQAGEVLDSNGSAPDSPIGVGSATATASSDPFEARAAVASLLRSGDPNASGTAAALLKAPDLLVRRAALRLLAKYPAVAMAAAESLLASGEETGRRTGVRLLGAIGSSEALARVGRLLVGSSSGVTVEALLALNRRIPAQFAEEVSKLRASSDPLVRAVATGISVD